MPEAPTLAVIIPAYNAERFLERAVESVFATGYPGIEVAIVDDGSTDGTLAVAWNLERRWAGRCTVLRHPNGAQKGVSASRNLGIENTTSEWISFLDADDEYLPNRFDDFRETIGKSEVFDGMYGLAEVRYDADGAAPAPLVTERFGIAERLTGSDLLMRLLDGQAWAVSAITLSRRILKEVGFFDVRRNIAEDCHLWMRVAACGRIIAGSLNHPVSVYWRHGSNTYTYRIEHRLRLLDAMLDAEKLARSRRSDGIRMDVYQKSVSKYAERSWMAAIDAGNPLLAWRVWAIMIGRWSFSMTLSYFVRLARVSCVRLSSRSVGS